MSNSWRMVERPSEVRAFLEEYDALCMKHRMCVGQWSVHAEDAGLQIESLDAGEHAVTERDRCDRGLTTDVTYVYTYAEHGRAT